MRFQKAGLALLAATTLWLLSAPLARAGGGATGCGDDDIGDIGVTTPISVPQGQSYTYDFQYCFTPTGNTSGWNHSIQMPPQHGSLSVDGSKVTYTPTAGYLGQDFWSMQGPGDGASSHDACNCGFGAVLTVVPAVTTPTSVPTLPFWGMILLSVLLAGAAWHSLHWRSSQSC